MKHECHLLLRISLGSIAVAWLFCPVVAIAGTGDMTSLSLETLKTARSRIVFDEPSRRAISDVQLVRDWQGNLCRPTIVNKGPDPVRIREVVLFVGTHGLPEETRLYGEGFTMLSQTGGTLGEPVDLGFYTDRDHYKIPQPEDALTVYNLLILSPPRRDPLLMAFTSCRRFSGAFRLRGRSFEVVLDTENLELRPGQSWPLEEFIFNTGPKRNELLIALADRLATHHQPRPSREVPTGWCSWYCFGADVTAQEILGNLESIRRRLPGLKYVQIDDGYQVAMGDWLECRRGFGGDMQQLCDKIRARGLVPAIWLAPFVAEESSRVFQQHPDWFVQDDDGKPLRSDRVSFGGWRLGPWYALDGTHPAAQKHLEHVFRKTRKAWGCAYFKLDALFWGALHGGRFHDPNATRVEAYRRGMEAIVRGAGDSFVLGGNHPMWPSIGLIDGSRSSMDIGQSWDSIRKTAREAFCRNWQNSRLWLNDPDVVMLSGDPQGRLTQLRATVAYATGGLLLAGDDLRQLSPDRVAMLGTLLPPTGVAASFEDDSFQVGTIDLPDRRMVCLFNWNDTPQDVAFKLPYPSQVKDFWSDEDLGRHEGFYRSKSIPPHAARLLVCRPKNDP